MTGFGKLGNNIHKETMKSWRLEESTFEKKTKMILKNN
jgi:hypothetical protein